VRGHLEISGPITADQLSQRCGLQAQDATYGLAQLEAYGEIMRGQFTPTLTPDDAEEYCDRRLLARVSEPLFGRLYRLVVVLASLRLLAAAVLG